jgi:hypothetical protein
MKNANVEKFHSHYPNLIWLPFCNGWSYEDEIMLILFAFSNLFQTSSKLQQEEETLALWVERMQTANDTNVMYVKNHSASEQVFLNT